MLSPRWQGSVMGIRTEHPIVVHRRRDRPDIDDRRLAAEVKAGSVTRIVAGSFARTDEWQALTPMNRHFTRVLEVADRARGPVVLMLNSAAAVHGMDRIGAWPDRVDVRIPRASGGRSSGAVRRHALGFDDVELMEWRGHLVTTPAQTALDLAAASQFRDAVIAIDQALWERRKGGALTDVDALRALVDATWRRGFRRVPAAIAFGTPLSDSVRESEGRVLLDRLGFPRPVLQKKFVLPNGRIARPDYYFEDFDHAAEFDGTGKYFDPDLLAGRTPQQALLEEKDRSDALRRMVSALSRWRTPAHLKPTLLYDILTADGLPSRLPRPRGH
ncbi:hypothetical protein RS84_03442 [Microbacterium hydrocarbonoxydans]|uniref:Transcriptional regulator, AbiEi antitoxin, Type IV TA system n=2 Tax=Microbacterium hydrocarbonoxydans TaxID=273678 RepID=A0A0M2HQQ2_9MICO|nr:hypothetical protein RS84_03442 [Microbacterium hydrocarbonoxydans]